MTSDQQQQRSGRGAWAEPGVEDVAPGVLRIPLPLPSDGLRAVNVYALSDGDGLTLIDAGWALAQSEQLLADALAARGFELGDIGRFLVTHMHRDHYTQAITLRRRFGSRVALGLGEKPSLDLVLERSDSTGGGAVDDTLREAGALDLLRRVRAAREHYEREPREHWGRPDDWLSAEQRIEVGARTLRVVPTPGHTAGHVVYVDDATNLLFAGDHVLSQITPSIGLEPVRTPYPLRDFLTSLQLVRSLPDMRLLPAHGPVADSTHRRIDELIDHHEQRLALSLAAVRAGASDALEVAGVLTWTRRETPLPELDVFNQTLAVGETLAHLNVLVLRGELVSERDGDGILRYR